MCYVRIEDVELSVLPGEVNGICCIQDSFFVVVWVAKFNKPTQNLLAEYLEYVSELVLC